MGHQNKERYRSGHNGAVLKTVRAFGPRGFESHLLRQNARIAQEVEQRTENPRVGGSNPPPGTISNSIYKWPLGQAVKTPPFHGGNMGSIPIGVTKIREYSSVGRAPALQAGCRRFKSYYSHHKCGSVVQLVRTPACHAGGRGFESLPNRHLIKKSFDKWQEIL
jgi:hypothetical protein